MEIIGKLWKAWIAKDSAVKHAVRANLSLNQVPDKRTFTEHVLAVAERLNVP
jgi:hypothetical protein